MDADFLDGLLKGLNTTLLGLVESHPDKEFVKSFLTMAYVREMEKDLSDNYQLGYELTLGKLVKSLHDLQNEGE